MVGYDINFTARQTDALLTHPLYIQFSSNTFETINANAVKASLNQVLGDAESAPVIAYLCWLLRVKALLE